MEENSKPIILIKYRITSDQIDLTKGAVFITECYG